MQMRVWTRKHTQVHALPQYKQQDAIKLCLWGSSLLVADTIGHESGQQGDRQHRLLMIDKANTFMESSLPKHCV